MIPTPEKRIAEFEKMGFGLFIHYGLDSQRGKGEWIMCNGHIPDEEYHGLFDTFTASGFDAGAIARMAKDAGMKYMVVTSKHHDGFALFHSKVSSYNVVDATPSAASLAFLL